MENKDIQKLERRREIGRRSMKKNRHKYAIKLAEWKNKNPNYWKEWAKKNKEKINIASAKYNKKHKDRIRNLLSIRKTTRMKFERDKYCGICSSDKGLEFHHWIYSKPVKRTDFSTLCKPCYKIQHGGIGK